MSAQMPLQLGASPGAADTRARLGRARAALDSGASAATALHAMHGFDPGAPAEDVEAIVRAALRALPRANRRAVAADLIACTSCEAGRLRVHDGDLFRRLGIHFATGTALFDALEAALDKSAGSVLVKVRDYYGVDHRVRKTDLDNTARTQLRRYRSDGSPLPGEHTHLHRDNIDPDGSQARAAWADLRYIAGRGDQPFKSERVALIAVRRLGQNPDDFTLENVSGGVIAVRKPTHARDAAAA